MVIVTERVNVGSAYQNDWFEIRHGISANRLRKIT